MKCPRCELENHPESLCCDCGYRFAGQTEGHIEETGKISNRSSSAQEQDSPVGKYCSFCGTQLLDKSKFCSNCGKQAPQTGGVLTTQQSDNDSPFDVLRFFLKLENWCALILLVSIFLPWAYTKKGGLSRFYTVYENYNDVSEYWVKSVTDSYGNPRFEGSRALRVIAYYLVLMGLPILSLLLTLNGFRARKFLSKPEVVGFIIGVMAVAICISTYVIGLHLTLWGIAALLSGVFLIIGYLVKRRQCSPL